ncbi:MAG: flagellar protein FliT [Rhodospirillaceae bacterium]
MSATQIITTYERVLALMQRMHAAAGERNWDRLVELETECKSVVGELIAHEEREPLAAAQQQRKLAIIRQLLALDAAIRALTEPWLKQLQVFLGTRRQERQLRAAYGAPDGA